MPVNLSLLSRFFNYALLRPINRKTNEAEHLRDHLNLFCHSDQQVFYSNNCENYVFVAVWIDLDGSCLFYFHFFVTQGISYLRYYWSYAELQ